MPPSLTLKQRLSALTNAQSAPFSGSPNPNSDSNSSYAHTSWSNAGDSYPYRETVHRGSTSSGFSPSPSSPSTRKLKAFAANLHAPNWMTLKKSGFHGQDRGGEYAFVRGSEEEEHQNRLVQEVLGNLIFQAGVDYETRPMVVMKASAFPDPRAVSYDLLLSRILSYLNLYVEADYTVVFLAAGSTHTPNWNWIWKAYRSLSRKYRKNLKQLYIVHSSFFSKMLFSLAGAIISPKFFRKITYITTLSELARHVPLTQIDIPPAVYQENLKYERKITLPIPTRSSVFGVPLEDLMGYDGEKGSVPRVIKDAAQYLRDSGMKDEGLFRRSPSSVLLRAAQEAYDRGNVVSLETFGDPHLAAVLIKKYLRDLPDPLIPEGVYGVIMGCPIPPVFGTEGRSAETEREAETVRYIRELILPELVPCALTLLSFILHLLHDVSLRSDANRMSALNLAMMISPNLVKGSNPLRDVMMCSVPLPTPMSPGSGTGMSAGSAAATFGNGNIEEGKTTLGMVITFCIKRYYEVFDEYVDRSEAIKPWRTLGHAADIPDEGPQGSGADANRNSHAAENAYVLGEDDDLDDESASALQNDAQKLQVSTSIIGMTPELSPTRFTFARRQRQIVDGNLNAQNNTSSSSVRSLFNTSTNGSPSAWNARQNSSPLYMNGKAKSMISIESSGSHTNCNTSIGTMRRGGSIAIGRGTTRKGSGSAVEVVSVTAAGFFVPPTGDPVPQLHASPTRTTVTGEDADGNEEEERVNVAERRRMFENSTAG